MSFAQFYYAWGLRWNSSWKFFSRRFLGCSPLNHWINGENEPMRTVLRTITFVALAGVLAMAQRRTPPDPAQMVQHHVDFLTRQLSLNAQQQQQATSIYTEEVNSMQSLHGQFRTVHQNLQAAVQKNDMGAIEQASNTIGSLTSQMTLAHAKADAALFQTLGPEQQSKFTQMQNHKGPGMHGHGWAGGPPPGASFK